MTVLFISHSSRELAQRVHDRLVAAGFGAVFLDIDPDDGIPVGRDWERELYGQLRRADAVVFIGTPASRESRWCHAELVLARSIGKPVFPLNAGATHLLLNDVQWIDLADEARLLRGLRQAGLDPRDSFAWDPSRSPYPGLASFDAADAAVFFGRGSEIEHLLRLLTPTLERGANRFVAIVGPSGSGKTSLVRAGLLPRLARSPDRWLVLPPLVPGERPIRNLARVLARAFRTPPDVDELAKRLNPAEFGHVLDDLRDEHPYPDAAVLLFVDQAEELLRTDERRAFLDLLAPHATALWIVATLRSESLGVAQELTALIDDPILLEPLDRSRLAEVVERPAARAGIRFQDGLVSRIVADTAGGDALPMLAYTLRELWERTNPGDTLTNEHYEAVGGVAGALRRQAERLTDRLRRQGRADAVVPTLMRLVDVDVEGTLTRRRLSLAVLSEEEAEVVRAFVNARLLTAAESTVDVVHEALIRQWPPLREAAESRGEDLRQRSELERVALDWDRAGRPEAYLLRTERAVTSRAWAAANPDLVADSALVADFLHLSARQDEVERRRQADVLATRVLEFFDEAELRLPLAVAAVEEYAPTPRAVYALARALAAPRLRREFKPTYNPVHSVDWSPDGTRIVSVTSLYDDGEWYRPVVWDPATGAELADVRMPDRLSYARWSPDGTRILVSGAGATLIFDSALERRFLRLAIDRAEWSPDGSRVVGHDPVKDRVEVWDAVLGRRLLTVRGYQASWSPSGRLLVGTIRDEPAVGGTTRVWNAKTGARLVDLIGVRSAWSPDGRYIAKVRDLELSVTDILALMRSSSTAARSSTWLRLKGKPQSRLQWSADGARLAVGTESGVVQVLSTRPKVDPESVVVVGPRAEPTGPVEDLGWSPDKTMLVTLSGYQAHVWHLGGPDSDLRLDARATGMTWSANSSRLLTLSDHSATIWDAATATALVTLRPEHPDLVSATWSPDQTRVLTITSTGPAQIWAAECGTALARLPGGDSPSNAKWSPSGDRIAASLGDGRVRVWDVSSWDELLELTYEHGVAEALAWSQDGSRLLVSADTTTVVWDVTTGTELLRVNEGTNGGAWSPDGSRIVTSTEDGAALYDVGTGARLSAFDGYGYYLNPLCWCRDGSVVLAAHEPVAVVWDTATGSVRTTLTGHEGPVQTAEFSPDQSRVLTGSLDGTARIWDPTSGAELACLAAHGPMAMTATWSPDGTRIATSAENRTVRIWSADQPADLISTAKRVCARELTTEERRRFGLSIPARPPR